MLEPNEAAESVRSQTKQQILERLDEAVSQMGSAVPSDPVASLTLRNLMLLDVLATRSIDLTVLRGLVKSQSRGQLEATKGLIAALAGLVDDEQWRLELWFVVAENLLLIGLHTLIQQFERAAQISEGNDPGVHFEAKKLLQAATIVRDYLLGTEGHPDPLNLFDA